MRSLSATLTAAQKEASAAPYVKVTVADRIGGVPRLAWSRLYTGSEADNYHAATMPGDGSLIRARVDPATYHLYYQRVASPGPGSGYSSWTDLGEISATSGIALASRGSTVLLFYISTNQRNIQLRESTDNGQTLGSPQFLHDPGYITQWMAADITAGGVVALFFVANNAVSWMKRTGESWGTPQSWPHTLATITGIGCLYQSDWNLLICGTTSAGDAGMWSTILGGGSAYPVESWGGLLEVIRASSGSNVAYRTPSLTHSDVFRAFFVEKYTGAGAYARPFWSHSPSGMAYKDNGWREAVPFNYAGDHGPAFALGTTYVWLSTPSGVWRALRAPATVEVTADVLEVEATEESRGGGLTVALRNDHGAYDDATLPAAIRLGAEVAVEWGYRGAAGAETSAAPRYWLQGWERRVHQGRSLLVLSATDGWGLLHGWRARRQLLWAAGSRTILGILTDLFTHLGLTLTAASSSSLLTTLQPAFTVHPGEAAAQAASRLLAMVPDALRFANGAGGQVLYPQTSDTTAYSYGTGHAVLDGISRPALSRVNWVQAYGNGVVAQDFLWTEVEGAYDRLLQVHDLNLASQANAQERATGELRRAALEPWQARLSVPVNCGQELYDVVSVTDGRLDLSGDTFRVVAMRRRLRQQGPAPRYTLELTLARV